MIATWVRNGATSSRRVTTRLDRRLSQTPRPLRWTGRTIPWIFGPAIGRRVRGGSMKLDELVAIDIHTHAEEPCGNHEDDGYDAFQAGMAKYFNAPYDNPPTVPQTAAFYRERRIGCVIFPVDCERETGFRRYSNE